MKLNKKQSVFFIIISIILDYGYTYHIFVTFRASRCVI